MILYMVKVRMESSEKSIFLDSNPSIVTYCVTLGKLLDLFSLILCIYKMEILGRYLAEILWGLHEILHIKCLAECRKQNMLVTAIVILKFKQKSIFIHNFHLWYFLKLFHVQSIYLFSNRYVVKGRENHDRLRMPNSAKCFVVSQLPHYLGAWPTQVLHWHLATLWEFQDRWHIPTFKGITEGERMSQMHLIFHCPNRQ